MSALGGGVQGAATLNLEIKHPYSKFPPLLAPDPLDLTGFVRYLRDVFWLKSPRRREKSAMLIKKKGGGRVAGVGGGRRKRL